MVLEFLQAELTKRTASNPRYSLRAFAKFLGVHSGTLSQILSGQRSITVTNAQRFLDALNIQGPKRQAALIQFFSPEKQKDLPRRQLKETEIAVMTGWEHFALLSLLETTDVDGSTGGLARRLGLSFAEAIEALGRLNALGLVRQQDGRWHSTGEKLSTSEDIPSPALRAAHRAYLAKASQALEEIEPLARDISGITFAGDPEKLVEVKKLIRDFRRQVAALMESGTTREVYRLNLQIFPLTRGVKS